MNRFIVFDVEGDGLSPTKIHVFSCNYNGKIFSTNDYDKIRTLLDRAEYLVGHNICRWDIPVLERLLDINISAKAIDTLALSWYLNPKRIKHGLEDWGEEFGVPKPKVNDWFNLSYEEYKHRCEEDVKINTRLWKEMWRTLLALYETEEKALKFLEYLEFKMYCARKQEESGWKLDVEKTEQHYIALREEQQKKQELLSEIMPKIPVRTKKSAPKRPLRKDGTPSKIGLAWQKLLEEQKLPQNTQEIEIVTEYEQGNPNSHIQVKDWLFSLGWEPQTFKYDKKDGELRKIPQINKQKQDGGGICDSIKELYPKEPNLEVLDGLSILNHRLGILSGFLTDADGRGYLKAQISGLTNTLRFKHKTIVNLPKPDIEYGRHVREVLIPSSSNHELCGSDMSSLEDRLKHHYLYPIDPEYVKSLMSDDYDPHLSIAVLAGLMTEEEAIAYKKGDRSKKPIRDVAKSAGYAAQYGAYPPRIALTAGITTERAKILFDAYWKRNWAIKEVASRQKVREVGGERWLYNPVSGFYYNLRSDNDRFSTLVQGTASYVFDLWVKKVLSVRPQLTAQFHDEIVLNIRKGNREECTKLLRQAIDETNEELKLNRELDVGIEYGDTYADVH